MVDITVETRNLPSAVLEVNPCTSIGAPTVKPCSSWVVTVIFSEPWRDVTFVTSAIEYVVLLAKKEGTLFTSSTVSHFVGCRPYSKSVSIKFCGFETLNLLTGSVNVSEKSTFCSCLSKNICIESDASIEEVSKSNVNVVSFKRDS